MAFLNCVIRRACVNMSLTVNHKTVAENLQEYQLQQYPISIVKKYQRTSLQVFSKFNPRTGQIDTLRAGINWRKEAVLATTPRHYRVYDIIFEETTTSGLEGKIIMAPSADTSLLRPTHEFPIADAKPVPTTQVHEITPDSPHSQDTSASGPKTLILNPSFITTDFDALRFSAAAHNQLPSKDSYPCTPASNSSPTPDSDSDSDSSPNISPAYSTLLISSPYNNPGHYLDLTTLPTASRLFALALTALRPSHPSYATSPYTASLNFDTVLAVLRDLVKREVYEWRETSFYVVVFRSQLRGGVDQEWLYKLDYESHREACESGGLLKYWFGKADLQGERRNLATCFWHSREDAYKGGLGPWHAKARRAGRELYESIVFTTHRFTVTDGAGEWRFEDWKD